MGPRISSRGNDETRTAVKGPSVRHYSSESQASKASEIMNFDLGPAVEKPLPVVSITHAPGNTFGRPENFEVQRGLAVPIGQAITRYSLPRDISGNAVDTAPNRISIQDLSEENMRIARLANDSRASFGGRELDEVSNISVPEERAPCHAPIRGVDELSDVSSMYEDETPDHIDDRGGILSDHETRRRVPVR